MKLSAIIFSIFFFSQLTCLLTYILTCRHIVQPRDEGHILLVSRVDIISPLPSVLVSFCVFLSNWRRYFYFNLDLHADQRFNNFEFIYTYLARSSAFPLIFRSLICGVRSPIRRTILSFSHPAITSSSSIQIIFHFYLVLFTSCSHTLVTLHFRFFFKKLILTLLRYFLLTKIYTCLTTFFQIHLVL